MTSNLVDTNTFLLSGIHRPPLSGLPPKHLVVIFHGVSADAAGMIALCDRWVARLPDTSFVAPNAPFPFDRGSTGFQWYSIQSRTSESVVTGLKTAEGIVDQFLDDALTKFKLDDSKLALLGFSQGGAIALHVGLRRARAPAAIVCMSGMLAGPNCLLKELTVRPPALLTHGAADKAVPLDAMFATKDALESAGVTVQCLVRPGLDHSFDNVTTETVGLFLERAFYAERAPPQ